MRFEMQLILFFYLFWGHKLPCILKQAKLTHLAQILLFTHWNNSTMSTPKHNCVLVMLWTHLNIIFIVEKSLCLIPRMHKQQFPTACTQQSRSEHSGAEQIIRKQHQRFPNPQPAQLITTRSHCFSILCSISHTLLTHISWKRSNTRLVLN